MWQVARQRISSGDQVLQRHGPGDGKCVWCGLNEDCDPIIFRCIIAWFAWSVIREATGGQWNPAGFRDFQHLIQGTSGRDRRLAWVGFGALAWVLWTARNKALIE